MAMYMLFEWKVIQNVVFKIVFAIHLKTYMNKYKNKSSPVRWVQKSHSLYLCPTFVNAYVCQSKTFFRFFFLHTRV